VFSKAGGGNRTRINSLEGYCIKKL